LARLIYEGMFLFDSNRYSRDPAAAAAQLEDAVKNHGGEMLASRLWDERRLAYPIKGQRRGTYYLTYFRLDGEQVSGLNRTCQLNDNLLRHMFVKVPQQIAEQLVSVARGEAPEPEPEPQPAATPPAEPATAAAESGEN